MILESRARARFSRLDIPAVGNAAACAEVKFNDGLTVLEFPNAEGRKRFFSLLLEMGPDVAVDGNVALLRKYGRFFFIDDRLTRGIWPSDCIPGGEQRFHHEIVSGYDFAEMTGIAKEKAWAMTTEEMTPAQQRCWRYASAFAALKVLKMELPMVIESPYALLGDSLRRSVHAYLLKQGWQIVLIGLEDEFASLGIQVGSWTDPAVGMN